MRTGKLVEILQLDPEHIQVTMISPRTRTANTRVMPGTVETYHRWSSGAGDLIQIEFPDASAEDREFLLTGYTPEDWEILFPPEPDDPEDDSGGSEFDNPSF